MPDTYFQTLYNKYESMLPTWKKYDELLIKRNKGQPFTDEDFEVFDEINEFLKTYSILKLEDSQIRFFIDELIDETRDSQVIEYLLEVSRYNKIVMEETPAGVTQEHNYKPHRSFFDVIVEQFYSKQIISNFIKNIFKSYQEINDLRSLEIVFKKWGAKETDLDFLFFRKDKLNELIKSFNSEAFFFDIAEATRCVGVAKELYSEFEEYAATLEIKNISTLPSISLSQIHNAEAIYIPKGESNGLVIINITNIGDGAFESKFFKKAFSPLDPKTTYLFLGNGYAELPQPLISDYLKKYITQYGNDTDIKKVIVYYNAHGDGDGLYIKPIMENLPESKNFIEKITYVLVNCYSASAIMHHNNDMGQLLTTAKLSSHTYNNPETGESETLEIQYTTEFLRYFRLMINRIVDNHENCLFELLNYASAWDPTLPRPGKTLFAGYIDGKKFMGEVPGILKMAFPELNATREIINKLSTINKPTVLETSAILKERLCQVISRTLNSSQIQSNQIDLNEIKSKSIKEILEQYPIDSRSKITLYQHIISLDHTRVNDRYSGKEEGYLELADFLFNAISRQLNTDLGIALLIYTCHDPLALKSKQNYIEFKHQALNTIKNLLFNSGNTKINTNIEMELIIQYWYSIEFFYSTGIESSLAISIEILKQWGESVINTDFLSFNDQEFNSLNLSLRRLSNIDTRKIIDQRDSFSKMQDNLMESLAKLVTKEIVFDENNILIKGKPLILMTKSQIKNLNNLITVLGSEINYDTRKNFKAYINKFSNATLATTEANIQVMNIIRKNDNKLYTDFIKLCREVLAHQPNAEEIFTKYEDKGSISFKLIDEAKKAYEIYIYDSHNNELAKIVKQNDMGSTASAFHEFINKYNEYMPEHFKI